MGLENKVAFTLTVNGEKLTVSDLPALRSRLHLVREHDFAELCLSRDDEGAALFVLIGRGKACLVHLRHVGDVGFSSRNPEYAGPAGASLEFYLHNGQRDEHPASWAVPTDEALRAVEYLFVYGDKAPWIFWHDDTQGVDEATTQSQKTGMITHQNGD